MHCVSVHLDTYVLPWSHYAVVRHWADAGGAKVWQGGENLAEVD